MKRAMASLTLALALIVTPAAATADGWPLRLLPPPEYDHAYTGGVLDVVIARDQDHVRQLCPGGKFGPTLGAIACSIRYPASCTIVLAPEADTKATGVPLYVLMRHEIGHCNGWPGDHKGALPYEEWAEDPNLSAKNCGLGIQKPCPTEPRLRSPSEMIFGK